MKIFLDANIFLRFYVNELNETHESCVRLLDACEQGNIRPYTSSIVISEIVYVLLRLYGFSKPKILDAISDLLAIRNLTVIDRMNTHKAIALYKKLSIKFGDCLISTQVPGGVIFCTYDAEFKKIPSFDPKTPEELMKDWERG